MYYKEIEEIESLLKTSESGLTKLEAKNRLEANGGNEIPKPPKLTIFNLFIAQFLSPIVFILIIAAIFSLITKSYSDSIFIFLVIFINAIIGTYQEWSSEKSAEKLQNMIKMKTKVIRDGNQVEIDSQEMVMGDIAVLESGDKVAADIRLMETNNLEIDESILTGESISKEKMETMKDENTPLSERTNMAYAGTLVTKGRGRGIVVAVGKDTEFGKVADKVLGSEDAKSPLIIRMEKFIRQISIGFIFLALALSALLYFKGYPLQEIFQNVVALTVSSIPEGLTIAMTIVLSLASAKMAKKKVIVKKLNAVESLGSCSVIATDKTGTLTANEQTAKRILLPTGASAYIKGVGYNDIGEVEIDEALLLDDKKNIRELAKMGVLNNEASLKVEEGKWVYHGDAIDIAFLALGYKLQVDAKEKIVESIPYESKQKYSAVFYEEEKKLYCTVKGAVEKVLEFCTYMQMGSAKKEIDKPFLIKQSEELAKQGFRVIAIAKGEMQSRNSKELSGLTFFGLVAFIDPIREDVVEAVDQCSSAGIKVVMITGDHPDTANAIGNRIGIKDIHARVSPIEKLEIVEELKAKDEFVAVTGDGVNDSPALKAANIGVAMGSGSDIAKETGNMIIVDDNFSTIVKGIEEGRRAYNNIRKVIYLLLSTGFSEVILYTLSIVCGLPIPLTAIQLLWLNLISNGIQGDALAFEKDTEDVMRQKVRKKDESIMNKLLVSEILLSSFVMAMVEFTFYICLLRTNMDIVTIRTYMLTLMVFMENIHIFNCRSETISCFKISGINNRFLIFSIIITSAIQLIIIRVPSIASFFGLTTVSIDAVGLLFWLTIPVILVMELFKSHYRRKNKAFFSTI